MASRLQRKLFQAESTDEGVVLVPFGFTINGTSDPDGLIGDEVVSVSRAEAGEFLLTLRNKAARVFFADAGVSNTADDVDLYCRCDWATAGVVKIFCQTAATQTDPTNDLLVGGFMLVKKTTRAAR